MARIITIMLVACLCLGTAQAATEFKPTYENGKAAYLVKDYDEALKNFGPLAGDGDPRAQFFIGFMYETGKGVPQDLKTALSYYSRASTAREIRAMYSMGYFHEHGIIVKRDPLTAHMWYNLATAAGHRSARTARDVVAAGFSTSELDEAFEMAKRWDNSHN